ncbi:hypothetical protein IP84_10505 [beta proteobacterium AAP99]|nr:hypothetical protein IP84_10505 [beta proteobacterium AAP99]
MSGWIGNSQAPEAVAEEATLSRFLEVGLQPVEARVAALERHGTDWLHTLIEEICEVEPPDAPNPAELAAWWGDLRANYTQWNQHLMQATLTLHEERQAEPISRFIGECPWRPLVDVARDVRAEVADAR